MTNLYEADFLFFAERRTHRAFLCQKSLDAGRLFVAGYPAIAAIDEQWQPGYNAIFYRTGKSEIWILGEAAWVMDTRQQCFGVGGYLAHELIPLKDTWNMTTKDIVKHAWESINKPVEQPPGPPPTVAITKASNNHRISRYDIRGAL